MRPSAGTHTLALLRLELGKTQKEMAELVGCSRRTIQAIELGNLALSAKLAEKIQTQTGVDAAWLARGETKNQMVDFSGQKYDCGKFTEIQIQAKSSFEAASVPSVVATFGQCILDLMSSMLWAYKEGKFVQWVFVVQTDLEKLRKRFGTSEEFALLFDQVVLPQSSREKPDFQPLFEKLRGMLDDYKKGTSVTTPTEKSADHRVLWRGGRKLMLPDEPDPAKTKADE